MPENIPPKTFSWSKVILTVLVIVLISGLISGALFWYLLVRQPTESTPVTTNVATNSAKTASASAKKDETVNWEIYTSTRDSYAIKYPRNWIIIPEKINDGSYIRNFDPTSKPPEDPANGLNYPKGYIDLRVVKDGKESGEFGNYTVKEWYEKLGTQNELDIPFARDIVKGSATNFVVNGINAKKAKIKFDETDEVIYILKGSYIYQIMLYPYGATEDHTVKLMLSTFKFL